MKKVFITGVAGFIGSNLAKTMQRHGFAVSGIDNLNPYYDPQIKRNAISDLALFPGFRFTEGDIRDQGLLVSLLTAEKPDLVIHLAAMAGVRSSIQNPVLYSDVNVNGTLILLEAMRKTGIKDLLFASSSSVYGNSKKVPFSETDPVDNPVSPYAASKRSGELICYTYHNLYNFNVFCLRFFTVYGPGQRPDMAIHKFGKHILEGMPLTLYGDGSTRRDYTFIDDIVAGVIASAGRLRGYEIINLGNNDTTLLADLVKMLESTLGKKAIIEWQPFQQGDVDLTYADITKARRLLDYCPAVSISEGLKKMFTGQGIC